MGRLLSSVALAALIAGSANAHDSGSHSGGITAEAGNAEIADFDIVHARITVEGSEAIFHMAVSGQAGETKPTPVGTLAGSITEGYLAAEHGDKKLDVRAYENAALALSDLAVGRVDAVIYSDDAGAYIARINALPVVRAVQVNREINAMVFRKGEDRFGQALNAAFRSIIDDGTYSSLSAKWLGSVDMAAELKKAAAD